MVASPSQTILARVSSYPPFVINYMNLAMLPPRIPLQEIIQYLIGRIALMKPFESIDSVIGIDKSLGGDSADARRNKRDTRP
jgi:hypothetical protein